MGGRILLSVPEAASLSTVVLVMHIVARADETSATIFPVHTRYNIIRFWRCVVAVSVLRLAPVDFDDGMRRGIELLFLAALGGSPVPGLLVAAIGDSGPPTARKPRDASEGIVEGIRTGGPDEGIFIRTRLPKNKATSTASHGPLS